MLGVATTRRRKNRREQLVVQAGLLLAGVAAFTLFGDYLEAGVRETVAARAADGTMGGARFLQAAAQGNASSATTAASNTSDLNSCGLTWAFDLWACVTTLSA